MDPLQRQPSINLHLHEQEPNIQLHIHEGEGELEYAAPWIWNLIGGERDNIISLDYKPVTGPNGGIEIESWREEGKTTDLVKIRVNWRVSYIDAHGREMTAQRDILIYTTINMPSLTDPAAEHEVLQRVKLVVAANCVPIVQSMDPSQRQEAAWKRVDDVVAARVFFPYRDAYEQQNNLYNKALVLFGTDIKHLSCNLTVEVVSKQREVIYIPPTAGGRRERYCIGPELTKANEAKKSLVIEDDWADVYQPLSMGTRTQAFEFLKSRTDRITVPLIRRAGFKRPADYIERLHNEIEYEQKVFFQARANLFEERSSLAGIRGRIKATGALAELQNDYASTTKQWFPLLFGKTHAKQVHVLQANLVQYNGVITKLNDQLLVAVDPVKRNALMQQKKAVQEQYENQRAALDQLEASHGKALGRAEGALTLMISIQQSLEDKRAQLDVLLKGNHPEGFQVLDENGALVPGGMLPDDKKALWIQRIANYNTLIQQGRNNIAVVKQEFQRLSIDFEALKAKASTDEFMNSLAPTRQRVEALLQESNNRLNQMPPLLRAFQNAHRNDELPQQLLINAIELLRIDQTKIQTLLREIHVNIDTLDRLQHVETNQLADEALQDLNQCSVNLHQQYQILIDSIRLNSEALPSIEQLD